MNPQAFARLVVTYGADLSRWPAALQPAARSLLEAMPELGLVLSEARELDAAINAQSAQISDVRVARLKALTQAKARSLRHSHEAGNASEAEEWTPAFAAVTKKPVFDRKWTWMAAGFAGAMCLLVLVQAARPVADPLESQSAIVALLEYDAGVLEVIR